MKLFEIHQIQLTKEDRAKINTEGRNSVPKYLAKIDMDISDRIRLDAKIAMNKGYYTHVANIKAKNLNEVFRIGNEVRSERYEAPKRWNDIPNDPDFPEDNNEVESIERFTNMHSISIGDLIIDDDNVVWVVATFGFEPVTIRRRAA